MTFTTGASSSKTVWTEEKIRATLASEPYNYQAISLPFGIRTDGHDRSATADAIFTGDWKGQSVLDVGSSLGYFLFEAKRHGAGRCVGMDLSADNVRRASTLADILGQDVEFMYGDLDAGDLQETFDNVLCLNVVHHLVDPILGLNRLIEAARRRVVLEVATVGSHDRRKLGLGFLQSSILEKLPAIIVGRGTAGEGVKQFYLTIAAIENLMRFRRGCFARVEIRPSGFKNRFLVVAEKRRIEHLLVVAAAPGAGLEKAAAEVASGNLAPDFAMKGAPLMMAANYHEPQTASLDRQILAYDIMRPLSSGAMSYSHDPAVDVIAGGRKVRFLTLWNSPDTIIGNVQKAIAASSGGAKKQLKRALENMLGPRELISRYNDWFAFTQTKGDHTIMDVSGPEPRLMSLEEWRSAHSPK
jgi:2-polyprenyl-3-methyl-5-hydroxy-6-metoxy-1,4-benzoquinol methylase